MISGSFSFGVGLSFLVSQLLAGLMTGAVFVVGHNARPMLERRDTPGFYELQCVATQNVAALPGARWFFGGLDRQIEHHLFPTLPPNRLREIAPEVRVIAARHGFAYTTASWGRTLRKALGHSRAQARTDGARAVLREAA